MTTLLKGKIDEPNGEIIPGWIIALNDEVKPILLVNGNMADLIEWPVHRPDVNDAYSLDGSYGYYFKFPGLKEGHLIELFAFQDGNGVRNIIVANGSESDRCGEDDSPRCDSQPRLTGSCTIQADRDREDGGDDRRDDEDQPLGSLSVFFPVVRADGEQPTDDALPQPDHCPSVHMRPLGRARVPEPWA